MRANDCCVHTRLICLMYIIYNMYYYAYYYINWFAILNYYCYFYLQRYFNGAIVKMVSHILNNVVVYDGHQTAAKRVRFFTGRRPFAYDLNTILHVVIFFLYDLIYIHYCSSYLLGCYIIYSGTRVVIIRLSSMGKTEWILRYYVQFPFSHRRARIYF